MTQGNEWLSLSTSTRKTRQFRKKITKFLLC